MGRNIVTTRQPVSLNVQSDQQAAAPQTPDNYATQIVKLIPVEIVGVYLGVNNLIAGQELIQWIIFVVILTITPFYLVRVAKVSDRTQVIVSTVSFIIWAISLGGPFKPWLSKLLPEGFSSETLGGILIMLYTLVVPMFYTPPQNQTT